MEGNRSSQGEDDRPCTPRYPELKMLTDAVASSKVISAEKTNELIQKLCRLTSEAEAMQLRRLAAISSRIKPHNEKVYYIIDGVQNAILENRQIQFQYYEYTQQKERVLKHNGYFYKLDPYALEWKNDHYYLIGYSHKHHGMAHFRVDRLAGIEILESTYVPQPDFDVADYTNKMIDMFAAGHTVLVELLCENRFMKTIVDDYDWMKITADAARNLFSWNSKCAATPFEISRMPAPAIRALFTACFIANGDYMVSVRKNDKGEKVFEIDDSAGKRREAFNLQMEQMMEAPGMEPD